MTDCPRCGEEINKLDVYSNEVNKYTVTVDDPEPTDLKWERKGTMPESCSEDNYYCPECDQLLFETMDGYDDSPQIVIDFLADYKRCCAKCGHFKPDDATKSTGECEEGGFTEIGNPYIEKTEEDCSGFTEKT